MARASINVALPSRPHPGPHLQPPPLLRCRRFPLPFALHMPLHLLCLWVLTVAASLAHMRCRAAAAPSLLVSLPVAMMAQLGAGFLLPSLLVSMREARLRAGFLLSRRAAACLAGGRKGQQGMSQKAAAPSP